MSLPVRKDRPLRGSINGCRPLCGALLIERSRIRPDPSQVRRHVDADAQQELNASVKRLGILQPITVRFMEADNIYQIVAGHRRYRAACAAGLAEVPCWVQSPKEQEVLVHQIVENWQRLDIHPYDLAVALARLRDASGYTQRDLARELGKSEGEISKCLALLELAPAVQRLACEDQSGRITRRHLYAVRTLPPETQLAFIQRAQAEAITATEMEKLAAKQAEVLTGHKGRRAAANLHRFSTSFAMLTLVFHKEDVTTEDILTALDEARLQVTRAASETTAPALDTG